MANTKSAQKRIRRSAKRRARNQGIRSSVRTAIRRVREAIEKKDAAGIETTFRQAVKSIDQAASKGVLHSRAASRYVSRLAKAAQIRA